MQRQLLTASARLIVISTFSDRRFFVWAKWGGVPERDPPRTDHFRSGRTFGRVTTPGSDPLLTSHNSRTHFTTLNDRGIFSVVDVGRVPCRPAVNFPSDRQHFQLTQHFAHLSQHPGVRLPPRHTARTLSQAHPTHQRNGQGRGLHPARRGGPQPVPAGVQERTRPRQESRSLCHGHQLPRS